MPSSETKYAKLYIQCIVKGIIFLLFYYGCRIKNCILQLSCVQNYEIYIIILQQRCRILRVENFYILDRKSEETFSLRITCTGTTTCNIDTKWNENFILYYVILNIILHGSSSIFCSCFRVSVWEASYFYLHGPVRTRKYIVLTRFPLALTFPVPVVRRIHVIKWPGMKSW